MIKIMISNTYLMCSPQFIVDVLTKKKLLCLIYLPTSQSGSLVEFCKPIFFIYYGIERINNTLFFLSYLFNI